MDLLNFINTPFGMLICFSIPFVIIGVCQLIDDNVIKPKYERKLNENEIYNEINKKTHLNNSLLQTAKEDFIKWGYCWSENSFLDMKDRLTPEMFDTLSLQCEGYTDTESRRIIEIDDKDIEVKYLNIRFLPESNPKSSHHSCQIFIDISVYKKDKIVLESSQEITFGNDDFHHRRYIMVYNASISNENDIKNLEIPANWHLEKIFDYNDWYKMKEKTYPKLLKMLLKR